MIIKITIKNITIYIIRMNGTWTCASCYEENSNNRPDCNNCGWIIGDEIISSSESILDIFNAVSELMNLSSTNIQQNMTDVKKILTDNEKAKIKENKEQGECMFCCEDHELYVLYCCKECKMCDTCFNKWFEKEGKCTCPCCRHSFEHTVDLNETSSQPRNRRRRRRNAILFTNSNHNNPYNTFVNRIFPNIISSAAPDITNNIEITNNNETTNSIEIINNNETTNSIEIINNNVSTNSNSLFAFSYNITQQDINSVEQQAEHWMQQATQSDEDFFESILNNFVNQNNYS